MYWKVSFPSVADRECLSLTLILIFSHPGSRILDTRPKNNKIEEEENVLVVSPFFVAINFTELKINLFLNRYRKKIERQGQKVFFTQKVASKLSEYGLGIRDPEKTEPGSRSQKGTGTRIRNTLFLNAEMMWRAP